MGSRRVAATLSSSHGVGGLLYSPPVETRENPWTGNGHIDDLTNSHFKGM